MQFPHCDQLNPYAHKTDLCGGNVHRISILWEKAEGYVFNPTKPESAGTICDSHMQSFIALGQRETFQYSIAEDAIIGEIAPPAEEGQPKPPAKEK